MSSALCVCIHASETSHAEGVSIAPSRGRSVEVPNQVDTLPRFSLYNKFLLCVSKFFFFSMCVWQCSFFRITDKLLPFDLLSILILDKLCMYLLCLYRYFI